MKAILAMKSYHALTEQYSFVQLFNEEEPRLRGYSPIRFNILSCLSICCTLSLPQISAILIEADKKSNGSQDREKGQRDGELNRSSIFSSSIG